MYIYMYSYIFITPLGENSETASKILSYLTRVGK